LSHQLAGAAVWWSSVGLVTERLWLDAHYDHCKQPFNLLHSSQLSLLSLEGRKESSSS